VGLATRDSGGSSATRQREFAIRLALGAHANTVVFVRSQDLVVIDTKGPVEVPFSSEELEPLRR
jgi:hypothetical protein